MLAAFQMASDVGGVIGPIVAGILVQRASSSARLSGLTGAIMLVSALWWAFSADTLGADESGVDADPDDGAHQVSGTDRNGTER